MSHKTEHVEGVGCVQILFFSFAISVKCLFLIEELTLINFTLDGEMITSIGICFKNIFLMKRRSNN